MSSVLHYSDATLQQEVELADVLTGPKEGRLAARLTATGFGETIVDWVEAERARGTHSIDILQALCMMQVQVTASIVAAMLQRPGHPVVAKLWQEMIADKFAAHAGLVRDIHERENGRGGS